MDFSFTENQISVRDLARGILDKEVSVERVRKVEREPGWFDRSLWSTLAEAGLLGLCVPEEHGGMGLAIPEACMLLVEIGRSVAPVPVLPVTLSALALAEHGSTQQKERWLAPLAAGKTILTLALVDPASGDQGQPATRATETRGGWVLSGEKISVPAVHLAERVLVPAGTPRGAGLFLVDPHGRGVSVTRHRTSSGEPIFTVKLDGAGGELAGTVLSGEMFERLQQIATVAVCAAQIGVCERALEITAGYVRERIQFGVPIGSFQAVQHRAADGYIDLEAMRWVTWRAAWKLSAALPALREVTVAKFWAADAGARIAAAVQHLHGGIGVDLDYPIHRYFLWAKALELSLGGAHAQLARLGRHMAAHPIGSDRSTGSVR